MAITRQAMMVSYVDSFWPLFVACLAVMPLVLFLRRPSQIVRSWAPVVHFSGDKLTLARAADSLPENTGQTGEGTRR